MSYKVLVADDEELERRALRCILNSAYELEILEASNGLEAVALAGEHRLDAAFLDIRMPGLDGIGTARELRRSRPFLPIVFLTAYDSFEYARSALRLRIDDFLLKPASAEEVKAALGRALSIGSSDMRGVSTVEEAARLLVDELRSSLGNGVVPDGLLERCLRLSGASSRFRAVIAMRCLSSSRAAVLKDAAAFVEHSLGAHDMLVFAGAGVHDCLCAAAADESQFDLESFRLLLGDLVHEARDRLGLRLALGAALSGTGSAATASELAAIARRALVLTDDSRPVFVVAVSTEKESAECCFARFDKNDKDLSPSGSRTIHRALDLIEERYTEDLSLERVASDLSVSSSHLSRLFTKYIGLGFAECLSRLRIDKAKAFLAAGRASIKEVASIVGFHDPAYFARVFRRICGESPAEYRSRIAETEGFSK